MTVYRRPDPIPLNRSRPVATLDQGPIRPEQEDLHHLVARRIFLAIVAGTYAEGGILPTEQALSEELGVSRTALREAIKGLASKGLLETRRRRGTMVLDRSRWNLLDADVIDWLRRDESAAVSGELWEAVVAFLPRVAQVAAHRGASAALRHAALVRGHDTIEARVDFLVAVARGAGNRFALSVITGALQNLIARDRSYLERATSNLTTDAARAIVAQLELGSTDLLDAALTGDLRFASRTVPA